MRTPEPRAGNYYDRFARRSAFEAQRSVADRRSVRPRQTSSYGWKTHFESSEPASVSVNLGYLYPALSRPPATRDFACTRELSLLFRLDYLGPPSAAATETLHTERKKPEVRGCGRNRRFNFTIE